MVTITDAALRQNVYETLYDTLKAHATASSYGTSSQPTITAAYIDDSQTFPQIVLNPIDVDMDEPVFDRTNFNKTIKVVIDIFTKKTKDLDILTDNIDNLMTPLKIVGITMVDLTENHTLQFPNEQKIKNKVISLTYMRRS